jgi:hypothetical protein
LRARAGGFGELAATGDQAMCSTRAFYRVIRFIATACIAIALLATSALADVDQYKFTNKTGQDAKDLHIEWEGNVSWPGTGVPPQNPGNAFAAAHGNGSNFVGLAQGQTGNGVPNMSDVVLDFHYSGQKPVISKAWWTFTNSTTAMELPGMPAPIRLQMIRGKVNEWAMTPATGNGLLAVTIDNTQNLFSPVSGDDGIMTAYRFGQFIESLEYGEVLSLNHSKISYNGISYSDDFPNIDVQVLQQDSTQAVTVSTVPEPATLLCVAGLAVLVRRRH